MTLVSGSGYMRRAQVTVRWMRFALAFALMVLVSVNSDVSDSWEREGDNRDYFETFAARGYALGVNVAVWVLTH